MVRDSFYVDDSLQPVASVEVTANVVTRLFQLLAKGGVHLHMWISNSREVMSALPEKELLYHVKSLDLQKNELPTERAL